MFRRVLVVVAAATILPVAASAQARRTGIVGDYQPPKVWPQRQRVFDLLHQRIAISFDLRKHAVAGQVTTRIALTSGPTDTVRLDASNLTIDAATDADGNPLRFTSDTSSVTVHLPRRAARGDTVTFTLAYHGNPERGMYFVPRR
ncbi:MAG TPA: hypothetical protein VF159_00905, partial [Gemmatimonadaceae bacterium]